MKRLVFAGLLVLASGCHTFMKVKPDYTTLPEETLRVVALEIEQAVKDGNREAAIKNQGEVVVETDEIQQAIRTRAARSALVLAFLQTGHAWERSNGTLAIIRSEAYKKLGTKLDRDRNALMVMGENADRWSLYESIQKSSKFPPRSLPAIQRIFFDARVQVMDAGLKYEGEGEETVQK
ncbi:MAG: hypothetical protein AMXMBFR84_37090 [Candidatus Hydrogenedentota bacterium]